MIPKNPRKEKKILKIDGVPSTPHKLPTPRMLRPSRCRTQPPPPSRKQCSMTSATPTVNFVVRKARNSGQEESKLINLTRRNYGGQLTFCSVVAACKLIPALTSNRSTVSLSRRLPRLSPAPSAHQHRYLVVCDPTWRFRPSHHWPLMTSSIPFDSFLTKYFDS